MENQIEEIKQLARDIFEPKTAIDVIDLAFAAVHGADRDDTHFMRIATHLYGKGYRKASDVAREIFAEVEEIIDKEINIWEKAKIDLYPHQDYYCASAIVVALNKAKENIKKKYESEKDK
ncbi:MAG: hypothetical protein IKB51_04050 [Clostridia bacterium]|nr:hypothetical protein [Clostridia bacterium]